MNKYFILVLCTFLTPRANAQTFADCFESYDVQYKKVMTQERLKELDRRGSDSVRFLLDKELDDCIIGKELPEFNLVGRSGNIYTNESLKRKVVVFNFWSVNCGPCVMEIPVLNRLQQMYKDSSDFIFISILYDKEEELVKLMERGLTKRRVAYEVIPDSKTLMKSTFQLIKAYPTNLFIDREGKVFMKTIGGISDRSQEEALEAEFRSIIDKELSKG